MKVAYDHAMKQYRSKRNELIKFLRNKTRAEKDSARKNKPIFTHRKVKADDKKPRKRSLEEYSKTVSTPAVKGKASKQVVETLKRQVEEKFHQESTSRKRKAPHDEGKAAKRKKENHIEKAKASFVDKALTETILKPNPLMRVMNVSPPLSEIIGLKK